jgi:hypothetical protein
MQDQELELAQKIVEDLRNKIDVSKRQNEEIRYIILPRHYINLIIKHLEVYPTYIFCSKEKLDYLNFMGYKLIPEEEALTIKYE